MTGSNSSNAATMISEMKNKILISSAAILLGVTSVVTTVFAQEPGTTFYARCEGGSNQLARASVVVRITPDEIVFAQGTKRFSIPVSSITLVAYSDPDSPNCLAGIHWNDPSGDVVLTIQKQSYRSIVAALRNMYEKAKAAREPATALDLY
jgi:hypothetical protein